MSAPTEPGWLLAKCDQRLALVAQHLSPDSYDDATYLIAPLSEPGPGANKLKMLQWERTCDNCGLYCPKDRTFSTGFIVKNLPDGHEITFTFGVCSNCRSTFDT